VPFFSISGSDFVEMFVGVGASRVRDLFEQAKQNSPCIIFMDEIDAVGRHRGAGLGGGHDEREQTLNQLLVEMDGFEAKDNIIMIAATNRPDILDPALLRPGRFDRQITVDRPDRKGRAKILEVHTRGKPLAKEINVDALAGQTPGFTGADLSNLVNEAALLAARTGKKEIGQVELEEGIMRVVAGPEKKTRVMGEKERLITAYHEMGHAIVGHYLEHSDPVHKVSIISRGQALGYTISLPSEDKFLTTRAELTDTMAMTLGGRAAEEIVFSEITTGASNDLEKVTATAKQMVMRFGMSEKLGPRVFGHDHGQPFLAASSPPSRTTPTRSRARSTTRSAGSSRAPTSRPRTSWPSTARRSRDLRAAAQARDDRARGVRGAARRQVRGRGLRARRAARRGTPSAPSCPRPPTAPAATSAPAPAPRPRRRHDRVPRPRAAREADLACPGRGRAAAPVGLAAPRRSGSPTAIRWAATPYGGGRDGRVPFQRERDALPPPHPSRERRRAAALGSPSPLVALRHPHGLPSRSAPHPQGAPGSGRSQPHSDLHSGPRLAPFPPGETGVESFNGVGRLERQRRRRLELLRRSSVITRWAPPRVESRTSTRCSSATSRATTISIASVSPVTQSAAITSGIARTAWAKRRWAVSSWRSSETAT
jgi:hypothetical protein